MFRPAWPSVGIYNNNVQDGCQHISMSGRYGRCNWQHHYLSLPKSSKCGNEYEYV